MYFSVLSQECTLRSSLLQKDEHNPALSSGTAWAQMWKWLKAITECIVTKRASQMFAITARGVTRGGKGGTIPRVPNHYGGAEWLRGEPKSPNNITSTSFNTVHLLLKDLRFEPGGRQTCYLARAPSNLVTPPDYSTSHKDWYRGSSDDGWLLASSSWIWEFDQRRVTIPISFHPSKSSKYSKILGFTFTQKIKKALEGNYSWGSLF